MKSEKIRFYIIRHGQTEWNNASRWQGSKDIPLDDVGVDQAKVVAERLTNAGIKHIYSSPLMRASRTAEIVQEKIKADITYDEGLKEVRLGEWEGCTKEEIAVKHGEKFLQWQTESNAEIGMGVENNFNLQQRVLQTTESICKSEQDTFLIVTHGAWTRALICKILDIPMKNRMLFEIKNTGVSIIEYDRNGNSFDIVTINDMCHL